MKLITDPVLIKLIQFYVSRVQGAMLRVLYKETGKGDSSNKLNIKKEISLRH
jgi:hypothetical protein